MTGDILQLPLVSIAIPVYNGGKYFETCLQGIKDQTYQNWECIINNNCSTDDTLEIATRFSEADKRFRIFNNESFVSMVENWNLACSRISKSSAYLRVLGADDWLFPESTEKMVAVMSKNPSVGICSSYRLNDKKVDMDGLNIWDGNVFNGKEILHRQLTRTLDISGSNTTVMFAVEHLKRIARYPAIFSNATVHEDTELEYEVMNISDVGFVFQVLSYTRRHEETATSTIVFRYNTLLQFNEKVLWDYKGNDKTLNRLYRACRLDYAYFMLFKTLTGDRDSVKWHRERIVRKFGIHEYLLGAFTRNKMTKLLLRIFRRLFGITA